MSNVNKMSMKDILNRVDVELNGVDQILYFYEGEDGYEKVNLLKEKMKRNTNCKSQYKIDKKIQY